MKTNLDLPIDNSKLNEWFERNREVLELAFIESRPEDFLTRDDYIAVQEHIDFEDWLQDEFDEQAKRENAICAA